MKPKPEFTKYQIKLIDMIIYKNYFGDTNIIGNLIAWTISDSCRIVSSNSEGKSKISIEYNESEIEKLNLKNRKILAEALDLIDHLNCEKYINVIEASSSWEADIFGDYRKEKNTTAVITEANPQHIKIFNNECRKSVYVYEKLLRLKDNSYLTDQQIREDEQRTNNNRMFQIAIVAVVVSIFASIASMYFTSKNSTKLEKEQFQQILQIIGNK